MSFNTSESQLRADVAWLRALPSAWLHPILTVLDPRPRSTREPHGDTSQMSALSKGLAWFKFTSVHWRVLHLSRFTVKLVSKTWVSWGFRVSLSTHQYPQEGIRVGRDGDRAQLILEWG